MLTVTLGRSRFRQHRRVYYFKCLSLGFHVDVVGSVKLSVKPEEYNRHIDYLRKGRRNSESTEPSQELLSAGSKDTIRWMARIKSDPLL